MRSVVGWKSIRRFTVLGGMTMLVTSSGRPGQHEVAAACVIAEHRALLAHQLDASRLCLVLYRRPITARVNFLLSIS